MCIRCAPQGPNPLTTPLFLVEDSTSHSPQNSVILVHGILGQRHLYWNVFKHRLHADGYRYHDVVLPYGLMGDLRIAARFLRDKVDATLRGDDTDKVDLVCHSAGGLVARYYLMYLGGHKHVDRLITMGSPHQGTYFSYTIGPPLLQVARQTRPGSHFLEEINGPGHIPPGVRIYNLWSPIDGIIWPHHNSRLPGSKALKVLTTHWGFLWRRDVYETVRDALEGRIPLSKKVRPEAGIAPA